MPELSPEAQSVIDQESKMWVFDDLRTRIMNGDLDDLDEAAERLVEGLEEEGEEIEDEVAEELTTHLWTECHQVAQQWADEVTDVDRLVTALDALTEKDITVGLFTDWPSLELDEDDRGGVLIWVNAWEDLSHETIEGLAINYAGSSATDGEVADDLVTALAEAGFESVERSEGRVSVPVLWRWHVAAPDDL